MSAPGFRDLSSFLSLPFGTCLTELVAPISEIYPFTPAPGGSQQQIRFTPPGGAAIDMRLYDRPNAIEQSYLGGVVHIRASPNSQTAFVWERSKAVAPSANRGVLSVRKQAHVDIYTAKQAKQKGLTEYGYSVPAPAASAQPELPLSTPPYAPARAAVASPEKKAAPAVVSPEPADAVAQELTRRYVKCLSLARAELGTQADPDDIRATADAVFERMA